MKNLPQTRTHARKRAHFLRVLSITIFILSWMASAPFGEQLSFSNRYLLFWLSVHLFSYALMGFAVYLQAKALSYDHAKVNIGLLCGIGQPLEEKSCLLLPVIPVCILVDLGTLTVLFS